VIRKAITPRRLASAGRRAKVRLVLALPENQRHQMRLGVVVPTAAVDFYSLIIVRVELFNGSSETLDSEGQFALHVAHIWEDAQGNRTEGARAPLARAVPPGASDAWPLFIDPPAVEGQYTLEVTLVQEQVAWFSGPPVSLKVRSAVTVTRSHWWDPPSARRPEGPEDTALVSDLRTRTIRCPADLLARPPWMSENVWNFIRSHCGRIGEPALFEFGMGASTCAHIANLHAHCGGTYFGVDHDRDWFHSVCSALEEGFPGARMWSNENGCLIHFESGAVSATLVLEPPSGPFIGDGDRTVFGRYLDTIRDEFDVVIVDGRARNEAVRRVLNGAYLREKGLLLLHDAGRGIPGYLCMPQGEGTLDYRSGVEAMRSLGGFAIDGQNGHGMEAFCLVKN
jgi:hypothetical protein